MKQKISFHWSKLLVLVLVLLTIYSYRFIFSKTYDFPYLEDFYNHSQWVVPLSPRIMGDGELYSYVAGKLIQGANPFSIAPEVPPLGKYLYSLSILLFENPLIISVGLYIGVVYVFYLYTKKVYKRVSTINLLTAIFASSALLITQIQDTVLDLPQLFFLLLHLLTMTYFEKSKEIKIFSFLPILSGAFLGAFSATKVPLLIPLILAYDTYILSKNKHTNKLISITITSLIIYMASYAQFFIQNGSILEWVKNQLWIINFYKNSSAQRQPLSVLTSILTGYSYKQKTINYIPEWSLTWLMGFILIFKKYKSNNSQREESLKNIKILLTLLIVFFFFTPFYKRYILLLLPFFILLLGQVKKRQFLYILAFIQIVQYSIFIQYETTKPIKNFQSRIEEKRYQDAYEYLSTESKENINREIFTTTLRKVDEVLQVSSVEVNMKYPSLITNSKSFLSDFSISRTTPIGNYELNRELVLNKQNNQWLVDWDWEVVSPKFSPSDSLLLNIDKVYGGTLTTADNRQLSWSSEKNNQYLYILGLSDKDDPLLQHVSNITGIGREKIRNKAYVVSDVGAKIPIGFIMWNPKQESLDYVIDSQNIVLEEKINRTYPEGLLHGNYVSRIQAIEKQHPEIFPNVGGEISLVKKDKTIPIFKSISRSGKNVKLKDEIHELLDEKAVLML